MTEAAAGLDGRRILVAGGSLGIGPRGEPGSWHGKARGHSGRTGSPAIEAALAQLDGGGHLAVLLDVSDARAWETGDPDDRCGGKVHGLVTAAGVLGPIGRLEDVWPEQLISTIAVPPRHPRCARAR